MNLAVINNKHCFKAPEFRKKWHDYGTVDPVCSLFSRLVYNIYVNVSCFPGEFENTVQVALGCPI